MTPTDENRFHALKFAAQTLGAAHPGDVIQAANLYLDFLEGRLATTAERAGAENFQRVLDERRAELEAKLAATHRYQNPFVGEIQGADSATLDGDVELSDLTESYPADEPAIAMADSPMEAEQIVDELFDAEPGEPLPESPISKLLAGQEFQEWKLAALSVEGARAVYGLGVPTEAEITAAVEQIADPAPVTEDASDAPEMTDEQVEATEDHWRLASDQIGAAEHEPEKELEPVGAHMRFAPWFATRK